MTKFWREGFWRSGTYGAVHWVNGHWVDRDDWDRSSNHHGREDFVNRLREARGLGSSTARFVNPNANCPVCGAEVFFYQNEFGSKVYFDELGPPWPKHPCTVRAGVSEEHSSGRSHQLIHPILRQEEDISSLRSCDEAADLDPSYEFGCKYGSGQWDPYTVKRRLRLAYGTCLLLTAVGKVSKTLILARAKFPKALKTSLLVFYHSGSLAYFDSASMKTEELEVWKIGGPRALVDELILQG